MHAYSSYHQMVNTRQCRPWAQHWGQISNLMWLYQPVAMTLKQVLNILQCQIQFSGTALSCQLIKSFTSMSTACNYVAVNSNLTQVTSTGRTHKQTCTILSYYQLINYWLSLTISSQRAVCAPSEHWWRINLSSQCLSIRIYAHTRLHWQNNTHLSMWLQSCWSEASNAAWQAMCFVLPIGHAVEPGCGCSWSCSYDQCCESNCVVRDNSR